MMMKVIGKKLCIVALCTTYLDLIYSRTWASFQRQRRKWKADALLIYSVFFFFFFFKYIYIYITVKYLLNLGSSPLIRFVIYK